MSLPGPGSFVFPIVFPVSFSEIFLHVQKKKKKGASSYLARAYLQPNSRLPGNFKSPGGRGVKTASQHVENVEEEKGRGEERMVCRATSRRGLFFWPTLQIR